MASDPVTAASPPSSNGRGIHAAGDAESATSRPSTSSTAWARGGRQRASQGRPGDREVRRLRRVSSAQIDEGTGDDAQHPSAASTRRSRRPGAVPAGKCSSRSCASSAQAMRRQRARNWRRHRVVDCGTTKQQAERGPGRRATRTSAASSPPGRSAARIAKQMASAGKPSRQARLRPRADAHQREGRCAHHGRQPEPQGVEAAPPATRA
jgi:hypothetical protein